MERVPLRIESGDDRAFVFRYVAEDGSVGVFVPTASAPAVGVSVEVSFLGGALCGVVGWRNDDASDTPGAGVVLDVAEDDDESIDTLIAAVRAIAYLPREEEGS